MIRIQLLALGALLSGITSLAEAQTMTVRPKSDVMLAGSSNVNQWACRTSVFEATISVHERGPFVLAARAEHESRVAVKVPVHSLKCGSGRMEQDLYDALDATRFPAITYTLVSYQVDATLTTPTRFVARTVGDITVAGVTRRVEIPVTAWRRPDGSVAGEGIVKLHMTDFGVKPPVALLGLIRARNDIEVSFRVLLDTSVVAALTRP